MIIKEIKMQSLMKRIKQLTKAILEMAYSVEESVAFAVKALLEKDEMLAKKIISDDDKIDKMENAIDRMCINVFALNQPVAMDLRSVNSK